MDNLFNEKYIGGVIVNDFIDMKSETHRRKVEDAFRDALRRDRARTKILRISQFGLVEMTRQRIRPSLKRSIFSDCPHCKGHGFINMADRLGAMQGSLEVHSTVGEGTCIEGRVPLTASVTADV